MCRNPLVKYLPVIHSPISEFNLPVNLKEAGVLGGSTSSFTPKSTPDKRQR